MKRKAIYLVIAAITAVIVLFIVFFAPGKPSTIDSNSEAPKQPIHWHPRLTIMIKGQEQLIPTNIGISIGNNIDNQISGMRMSPTHTHESDGTLHLENNRPWLKPETLTLGYFFEVWGKNFNSSCIFEYCSDEDGMLTMTVNRQPNNEFDKYIMHDKDEILIEYR